jgi:hypothetical protein
MWNIFRDKPKNIKTFGQITADGIKILNEFDTKNLKVGELYYESNLGSYKVYNHLNEIIIEIQGYHRLFQWMTDSLKYYMDLKEFTVEYYKTKLDEVDREISSLEAKKLAIKYKIKELKSKSTNN